MATKHTPLNLVKQAFIEYVLFIFNCKEETIDEEQKNHLQALIRFWLYTKTPNIEELFAIKEHHSYLNGRSGNEELWMKYVKLCMSYRLKKKMIMDRM